MGCAPLLSITIFVKQTVNQDSWGCVISIRVVLDVGKISISDAVQNKPIMHGDSFAYEI
jgi:hypothetical protein